MWKIGKICGNIRWNVVEQCYEACNALATGVEETINADQGNVRIFDESEGLDVFIMKTAMMEYNREPLSVMTSPLDETLQLFLILLYTNEKGALGEELLDMLHGNGEDTSLSENLKAAAFWLRKILEGNGLPEHEYIRAEGRVYRFDKGSLSVYVGAKGFEETARKALKTGDENLLRRACRLCQGKFMAQLVGEEWVSIVEARYQELYFQYLRVASYLMKASREYAELLELCSATCNPYLYKECQIMKIDCPIAMKRFKDTMQIYDQAVIQYLEKQGPPPSEKMLERFRTMSGQARYISDTLKDVKGNLQKRDWVNGSYYCSYPAFIGCYRPLVRMSEWIGFTNVVLYCTLLGAEGKPLDAAGDLLRTASARLHEAIRTFARKGDSPIYYNPSQYLVMFNGTSQRYCLRVLERIDRTLHLWDGGHKMKLNYQIMSESLL